ncbi:methyltransferase [bacterium]|nr:methyltransferase [bacterium]
MRQDEPLKKEDETLDSFYEGQIQVLQKKKGYRFSVDAPLLADFIQPQKGDELLDLGTGSGIISLLLSFKPYHRITALEVQPSLADLARRNVKLNGLEDRITVVEKDLFQFHPSQRFDVIFSNPPYIKKQVGHLSPCLEKSVAKHEIKCDIEGVMQKTVKLLKKEGKSYFIFPARREDDFMEALKRSGMKIKKIRYVYPSTEEPPHFFMTECDLISLEMIPLNPMVLYDRKGNYTPEVKQIFTGRRDERTP